MCSCEPGWTCPRCAGTRFDLAYFDAQSDLEPNLDATRLLARLSAVEQEREAWKRTAAEVTAKSERAEAAEARVEAAERERDHYRDLVEKVGVANALRGLLAAAEPLCGKLEVIPGRLKLPPEYYPAASPLIGTLREAVAAARAVLAPSQQEEK